ncbi:hypothetical protein L211DRAFT_790654, partial [Terfezia boudieri ATCC MYA-4762]
LWQESGIERYLRNLFSELPVLCLYGDPAYAPAYGIIGPYRTTACTGLTPVQEAMNVTMSSYQIVVEWGFTNILNQFGFGEWKRNQRIGLSSVATCYALSVLLYNCQTCLRGRNQISERFKNRVRPPSLSTYLTS